MTHADRYDYDPPDVQHFKSSNGWKLRPENQTQEVCPVCGKTFTKTLHQMKYCPTCSAKRNTPKNRCACGRMLGRSPETTCSFCLERDRRIKHTLVNAEKNGKPKQFKCGKCRTEIPDSEWKMFDGLCFECYTKREKQTRWVF